ncbi:hypothetical protein [Roseivirga echinicomitans]|uniref:Uncharacterized protein n=1 Tax=Roseivirga echinicomitans TaxID=296218 RepID=A0A150XJW7_9BACT|nr:hypothetical protein [Roseivirga echinicomitans]KYG78962.1 hypothetical protein AWN68_04855 [Roseivirga echinicomitans]
MAGLESAGKNDLLSREFILEIPGVCLGCIGSVEQFILDNVDTYSNRVGFILYDITSVKTTQIRFGGDITNKSNVYLDKGKVFDFEGNISLYPAILRLKGGSVESYELVSPENENAMENFYKELLP